MILPHRQDFASTLTTELWARLRTQPVTGARPRRAATLILVDRTGPAPKVLLGKRHGGHKFMPGKFVFPGGRVEPADARMSFAGDLDPVTAQKLASCLPRQTPTRQTPTRQTQSAARAIALASIRETFEETGLVIGVPQEGSAARAPTGAWQEFVAHGFAPTLAPVHFIGRAITPPRNKLRFDALFLAVDASAVARRVDGFVGPDKELVELVWATIPEAFSMGLVAITRVMLAELENRIAQGMRRELPTPFYRAGRRGWVRGEL